MQVTTNDLPGTFGPMQVTTSDLPGTLGPMQVTTNDIYQEHLDQCSQPMIFTRNIWTDARLNQ